MRIDVHIHIGEDDPVLAALRRLEHKMSALSDKVDELVTHVTDLKTAVSSGMSQITTVAQNVAVALDGLAALIADLRTQLANQGVDQATLDKITAAETSVDQIKTDLATGLTTATDTLTNAVTRDTPTA
jgi:hypothetical protein